MLVRINSIEFYNRIEFFKNIFCVAIDSDNAKLYRPFWEWLVITSNKQEY